jgi:hypothetical protein
MGASVEQKTAGKRPSQHKAPFSKAPGQPDGFATISLNNPTLFGPLAFSLTGKSAMTIQPAWCDCRRNDVDVGRDRRPCHASRVSPVQTALEMKEGSVIRFADPKSPRAAAATSRGGVAEKSGRSRQQGQESRARPRKRGGPHRSSVQAAVMAVERRKRSPRLGSGQPTAGRAQQSTEGGSLCSGVDSGAFAVVKLEEELRDTPFGYAGARRRCRALILVKRGNNRFCCSGARSNIRARALVRRPNAARK